MESEIEAQVSLKKTILRAEWWVLASIMGKQFKVVPKRSKFETLGKRNCLQWQKKKLLRDKNKYSVKIIRLYFSNTTNLTVHFELSVIKVSKDSIFSQVYPYFFMQFQCTYLHVNHGTCSQHWGRIDMDLKNQTQVANKPKWSCIKNFQFILGLAWFFFLRNYILFCILQRKTQEKTRRGSSLSIRRATSKPSEPWCCSPNTQPPLGWEEAEQVPTLNQCTLCQFAFEQAHKCFASSRT